MFYLRRKSDGFRLPPMDDDGTDRFIVWPTRKEAEQGFEHQAAMYEITRDEFEIAELRFHNTTNQR